MIELKTPDGIIKWKLGKLVKGDKSALEVFQRPRPGSFGRAPGLPSEKAHRRRDSFLQLVGTIWPDFEVIRDTDPQE
ncbi:MAG: hypothetical protein U0931_25215 [Vulcanimicrobiota bacterium]